MTRRLLAVFSFALVAASSTLVLAQQTRPAPITTPTATSTAPPAPAEASGGTQVALIDISYIFRKHPGYAAKRDALRDKFKSMTSQETAQKKQLQLESEKLKDFTPGSLEAKDLEARLTQQASDFQVQAQLNRKELADEEVKLYYETYMDVQRIVERVAQEYRIDLVIRFDREPMEATDQDSIRRGLMNPVVFQRHLDITDIVLKQLPPARTVVTPKSGTLK